MNIILIFILLFSNLFANTDSSNFFFIKIKSTCDTCKEYIEVCEKAIKYFKRNNNYLNLAIFSEKAGDFYCNKNSYYRAIQYYNLSVKNYLTIDSLYKAGLLYKKIGKTYENIPNYPEALNNYYKSYKIWEKINNKKEIASFYNSIGLIFHYQGLETKAINNYFKALEIVKNLKNDYATAMVYNNIGVSYHYSKEYDSSIVFYNKALSMFEKIKDNYGISMSLMNLANIYSDTEYPKRNPQLAEKFFKKAIGIKEKINDKVGLVSAYTSISALYQSLNQYQIAIQYALKAYNMANEMKNYRLIMESSFLLSQLYKQIKNFEKAYEFRTVWSVSKDSVLSESAIKTLNQLREQFNAEQREKDIQIAESKLKEKELKLRQQQIIIYTSLGGALMLVLLIGVIYNSYSQKKKANKLLEAQNVEISRQKSIIEQKNENIIASINYAKRIQDALLPSIKEIDYIYQRAFVLYKPKDIVSGDFYWFVRINNLIIFAVADCTGHGVPGAFMSILGTYTLNQVVREYNITEPDEILNKLNELLKIALHTNEKNIKDGMDIAICCFNTNTNLLKYAGANTPLYYISCENNKIENSEKIESNGYYLYEVMPTKMPIGDFEKQGSFSMVNINVSSGDMLYLTSDGYTDQFGGDKDKKLKRSNFKKILIKICNEPINKQKEMLNDFFEEWKGNNEQTDDVCVIGIKF
ncbi:MAG: SpoIIE family protein phosphatase [Bacteroidales bacterium]|nr:SpoIIE family protein phosphatase [Bacteroidales bacterium]